MVSRGAAASDVAQLNALEDWEIVYGEYENSNAFHGYVGDWSIWTPERNCSKQFKAYRLFKQNEEGDGIVHRNLYEPVDSQPMEHKVDEQTGNLFNEWSFKKESSIFPDGISRPYLPPPESPFRRRLVSVATGSNYHTLSGCMMAVPSAQLWDSCPPHFRPTTYASEQFIYSQTRRWSASPVYSVATGSLQAVYSINERHVDGAVDVNIPADYVMEDLLGQLAEDPGCWVDESWTGTKYVLENKGGGRFVRHAPQETRWVPPPPHHTLLCLPDLNYMAYPDQLPWTPPPSTTTTITDTHTGSATDAAAAATNGTTDTAAAATDTTASGGSWEFGVLASKDSLVRIRLVYGPSGEVQRLESEVFTSS